MSKRPQVVCIDELANKSFDRRGKCKWCGSDDVVKNGKNKGRQLFKCKECGHQFFNNGKLPRMRKSKDAVALAIDAYYEGQSLRKVQRLLKKFAKVDVGHDVIWDWIQKYTPLVRDYLSTFRPALSGAWYADETILKFRGRQHYHWDCIDEGTRFVVGNHISEGRSMEEGKAFFRICASNKPRPHTITTDGMPTYHRAINKQFYSRIPHRKVNHISIEHVKENILIERWHGTLKDRTRVMRGLKSPDSQIPNGFVIHYNFLRGHQSLKGKTPAEVARIDLPFEDGWSDLIKWATHWQTMSEN